MVWPFRARRGAPPAIRELLRSPLVDVHSHLLPGIDDGPADAGGTAAMLAGYAALGFSRVAATPHWRHPGFRTPAPEAVAAAAGVARRLPEAAGLEISTGAEIAFDERFAELVEADALPRLGRGRAYLLELSALPGSLPRGLAELAFRLCVRGVALVLAHVERIPDLRRGGALAELRTAGALAQIDLTSLAGKHGGSARAEGLRLVEGGGADLLATDAHDRRDLALAEGALADLLRADAARVERLAAANPARVLDGAFAEVVRDG